MKLKPTNKYLVLKPFTLKTEKKESLVALPEKLKKGEQGDFACYEILEVHDVPPVKFSKGNVVVVEQSMVREIAIGVEKFLVVTDNFVVGTLTDL